MNRKPRTDLRKPSLSNDPVMKKKTKDALKDIEDNLLPPRSSDGNLKAIPIGNLTPGYMEMNHLEHSLESLYNAVEDLSRRVVSLETKMRLMTRGSRRHLGV